MSNEYRHALTRLRSKLLEALESASSVSDIEKLAGRLLEIDTRLKRNRKPRPLTGQSKTPSEEAGGGGSLLE